MGKPETATQRNRRLEKARQLYKDKRDRETASQREARLEKQRNARRRQRAQEVSEISSERLFRRRTQDAIQRALRNESEANFEKSIDVYAEKVCEVCTKKCYPKQVQVFRLRNPPDYLPPELVAKEALTLCHRCKTHISSKKTNPPAKSYWNHLDPGPIPPELEVLSQSEQRLLARINPFLKIIKCSGLYGQYGFKGQAVLFATDIFEVVEKLPTFLPRSTSNSDIIVVTEHLENINITRDYSVSKEKLIAALEWLKLNNPLYRDVTIDGNVHLDERDIIRLSNVNNNEVSHAEEEDVSPWKSLGDKSRIIRASWHQGDSVSVHNDNSNKKHNYNNNYNNSYNNNNLLQRIFNPVYAGVQCCAMALTFVVRSSILDVGQWNTNILNENMIEGDSLYSRIRTTIAQNNNEDEIAEREYLNVADFDIIKDGIHMFYENFRIEYDGETDIYGSLSDRANHGNIGYKLKDGILKLFEQHEAGILIANGKSFALIKSIDRYYFVDSHSCGPKGSTASDGKACAIQCDDITEFHRICKRATGSRNVDYTINYITVIYLPANNGYEGVHVNLNNNGRALHLLEPSLPVNLFTKL